MISHNGPKIEATGFPKLDYDYTKLFDFLQDDDSYDLNVRAEPLTKGGGEEEKHCSAFL